MNLPLEQELPIANEMPEVKEESDMDREVKCINESQEGVESEVERVEEEVDECLGSAGCCFVLEEESEKCALELS